MQTRDSCLTSITLAFALAASAFAVAAEDSALPQQPAIPAVQESAASRLAATTGQNREQVARRVESVSHLLETSSAARQIETSQQPEAIALREEARGIHRAARDALDAGDLQKASKLLTDATMLMFKAVRQAAPEEVTRKKMEADFRIRHESVKALLSAYKRIASEKSATQGVSTIIAGVEAKVDAALKLADAGKFADGRIELDQAYIAVKTAVRTLRHGETLVRSLNFASKEEEYRYELDRNDTHQMLIKVLVDEKRAESPDLDRQVAAFVEKSKELRVRAESSAAAKDFADAVKLLEDSTAELVKAIRNAGIYIPG